MNHTKVIGPKILPTRAVPYRWQANSAMRMTIAIGTIYGLRSEMTIKTSTALSTR